MHKKKSGPWTLVIKNGILSKKHLFIQGVPWDSKLQIEDQKTEGSADDDIARRPPPRQVQDQGERQNEETSRKEVQSQGGSPALFLREKGPPLICYRRVVLASDLFF